MTVPDPAGEPTGPEGADDAAVGWSVNQAVPVDWAPHIDSLARWKQGDLVLGVPVSYLVPPGTDPVTGAANTAAVVAPVSDPTARVAAIICTQTCDLGASPPGDRTPFIQLAPLIPHSVVEAAEGKSRAKLARHGHIGHLIPTNAPCEGDEGAWYGDLRVMFSASKGILLDRDPVEGFEDEYRRLNFGEVVALRYRRPALHPVLSEALPPALAKFAADNQRSPAITQVEQVRLLIDGDRLNPQRAQIFVIGADRTLGAEQQLVWHRFQAIAAKLFEAAGLVAAPIWFTSAHDCSAELYRRTVPVRCERLNSRVFW